MPHLKAAVFAALLPLQAYAQFTDFEDLTLRTTFPVGSSFTSNGFVFDVVLFGDYGSQVAVGNFGHASGSGQELFLPNTIGLDFQLPSGAQQISLLYGAFCCDSGIVVNGVASPLAAGLSGLDGSTIGGTTIAVTASSVVGGEQGELTVTGDITSFIIGGTEFAIDNVKVVVPEPGTSLLWIVGSTALVMFCVRTRRSATSPGAIG